MELKEALLKRRSVRKFTEEAVSEEMIQDCSAATENILLRVTDLGLGAVWCGIHPQKQAEKKVRQILDIPQSQVPLNIIHIGHPAEEPEARDQYEEKRIHYIK